MKILNIFHKNKELEDTKEIFFGEIVKRNIQNVSASIDDLKSFMESIHIKKRVINQTLELYKKGIINQVKKSEFKKQLKKLDLEEITVDSIVDYVTRFDYRKGIKK